MRWLSCPDLIIIGVGERMTARLDPVLVKHLGSKGIRVEQMDTVSAPRPFVWSCLDVSCLVCGSAAVAIGRFAVSTDLKYLST